MKKTIFPLFKYIGLPNNFLDASLIPQKKSYYDPQFPQNDWYCGDLV